MSSPSTEQSQADYAQTLAHLFSLRRFGVMLGLSRMEQALAALGNPEQQMGVVVHIAGTNGKGSTAAFVASAARACGLRVGVYSSPHLVTVRERMTVNNQPIPREQFMQHVARIRQLPFELTFFEVITAIGFLHFAEQQTELAIVEVGLGGRFDATNVLRPTVTAVTGVAYDHVEVLGPTLAEIAFEKAGIFKRDVPAIVGISGEDEAIPTLRELALQQGAAPIVAVTEQHLKRLPSRLPLVGAHQRKNAACALAICDALTPSHFPQLINASALFDDAQHPGRFETVASSPRIILDGAHNPQGAQALALAIDEQLHRNETPRVVVCGVSRDKDIPLLLAPLIAQGDIFIATTFANDRALAAADLQRALQQIAGTKPVHLADNIDEALRRARYEAGKFGVIVICGSLFLVGEARGMLLGLESDPIAVTDPAARKP